MPREVVERKLLKVSRSGLPQIDGHIVPKDVEQLQERISLLPKHRGFASVDLFHQLAPPPVFDDRAQNRLAMVLQTVRNGGGRQSAGILSLHFVRGCHALSGVGNAALDLRPEAFGLPRGHCRSAPIVHKRKLPKVADGISVIAKRPLHRPFPRRIVLGDLVIQS